MIANRLREFREQNGWRLEDVADLSGYDESTISLVERGKRNLSPKAKVSLARALGVRVRDLFPKKEVE